MHGCLRERRRKKRTMWWLEWGVDDWDGWEDVGPNSRDAKCHMVILLPNLRASRGVMTRMSSATLRRATKTIEINSVIKNRVESLFHVIQSHKGASSFWIKLASAMADQVRPTSGIPRLSRLPVRSSIPSLERTETSIGSGPTDGNTRREQVQAQPSRPGPASLTLGKVRGPEAKVFVKPQSTVAASRKHVTKEGSSETPSYGGIDNQVPQRHRSNQEATKPTVTGPRPSLSDRAIHSLSNIPPSPSPRRRQSGFFPSDSPAIRPPSSLGRNRPSTSVGFHPPLPTSIPNSPSKRPRLPNPLAFDPAKKPTSTASRTSRTKTPHQKDKATVPTSTNTITKPALKSSAALRETIANAKAARRAAPKYDGDDVAKPVPVSRSFDVPRTGFEDDHLINPLHKRITSAKSDGKLDISGMRLKVFPQAVLEMDSIIDGPAWYESVDLVRLNAADNELEDLGWDRFDESSEATEKPSPTDVFAALQTLDLHGNHLHTLPSVLPDLEHLTVLNISRNRLKDTNRDILNNVFKIESLRVLDLSDNQFSGPFPPPAGCRRLEDLNIHSNAFTTLPEELSACTALRKLNASNNNISGLPLLDLPNLTTLNLSSNQIAIDDLMAAGMAMPKLTTLDISRCRIDHLPPLPSRFPQLTTLIAFDNRISVLDVECVRGLEILDLKGNDLRSLPAELSLLGLKKLLVGGNPMRAPRREILESSSERLMEWLKGRLPAGVGDDDETF